MDRQTDGTNCQIVSDEQNKAKKFLKEKQREKIKVDKVMKEKKVESK